MKTDNTMAPSNIERLRKARERFGDSKTAMCLSKFERIGWLESRGIELPEVVSGDVIGDHMENEHGRDCVQLLASVDAVLAEVGAKGEE